MAKIILTCKDGKKEEIDIFKFSENGIAVLDGGHVYKPVYGGASPNSWFVKTAIEDGFMPDSEWYLEVEGVGRHVTFFTLGFGTGYDFDKRKHGVGREKFASGADKKFKSEFLGLRLFILRQLPERFLHNPHSGKLIRKLVRHSIPIIKVYSSIQMESQRWLKSWGSKKHK
jgi:hypothetical protein